MQQRASQNSNTTLVKVKFYLSFLQFLCYFVIQIQHLLKLNYHWYGWRYLNCGIQIQHLLKLNSYLTIFFYQHWHIQIQHLLKLNFTSGNFGTCGSNIQIQHLLKLNINPETVLIDSGLNSNTTLVKVKLPYRYERNLLETYSNTTLVKVKSCMLNVVSSSTAFKYNTC